MNDSEMDYPIGTANTMLGQHLHDNGIHSVVGRNPKPRNWDEIKDMVQQPRPIPASYQAQFEAFLDVISEVSRGRDVVRRIYPLIAGDNDICSAKGCRFSNLEKLTDGSIAKVSPDYYDGANPSNVDQEILAELCTFVKPLAKKDTPVYPNFFVELKGRKYEFAKAEQRARYSGAIGSRAIHRLRSFAIAEPGIVFDGSAYTITAIYHLEALRLYAHHPVKPSVPGGPITYQMTLIGHFAMNGDLDSFRKGVTAFRNSREWAQNRRNELIAAATTRKQYRDMTPIPDPPSPRLPVPGWAARPGCSPS